MRPTLPAGWQWVPLSRLVSKIEAGKSFKCEERPPVGNEAGIVKVSAVTWGTYDEDESKTITDPDRVNEAYLIRPGDFLFSRANTLQLVGACVLVRTAGKMLLLSDKILRLVMPDAMKPWVLWFLRSAEGRQQIEGLSTGNQESMRNIGQERIGQIEVPIPAMPTMQRIVSRIEELFSEIDEGERALERVQKLVERYCQSVLKAAVTGELTREWRVRRSLIPVAEGDATLPTGWRACPLSELGEFGRGKSKHRPRNDPKLFGGPYPFLQTGAVRASRGMISGHDSTYSEFGLAQSKLWPTGTVCITIAANIAASGVLAFDACFPDSVVGLVPAPGISGEYIEYFIRTARESLDRYAPATAQKNINLDILEKVLVPLPPPEEQLEVCSRVREVFSRIDALERMLAERRSQSQALRQSILKSAFSGQLVPQDPNDEPTSALLARLSARYAESPLTPTRRGRQPRQAPATP